MRLQAHQHGTSRDNQPHIFGPSISIPLNSSLQRALCFLRHPAGAWSPLETAFGSAQTLHSCSQNLWLCLYSFVPTTGLTPCRRPLLSILVRAVIGAGNATPREHSGMEHSRIVWRRTLDSSRQLATGQDVPRGRMGTQRCLAGHAA